MPRHPLFPPAPKPKSLLGYHRVLSPKAGVRVSPLCLGAMNFGESWKSVLGECTKETAFDMLDFFWDQGGNFIDTANNYQAEESEAWIGEWMEKHGNRDEMVLATKFTTGYRVHDKPEKIKSNFQGNHAKSLKHSVEASLAKLRTTYIDLLYVHWWDFSTGVEELMRSLHHLVVNGKLLYLGISDTPAWIVVKANEYARQHGLTPFSVYQGHWSAAFRDFEREILPMCRSEGLALAPWGSLGRGMFKAPDEYNDPAREGRQMGPQSDKYIRISAKLAEVARAKGSDVPITSIALAYVMHKAPYVFPIVGGRKVEHLRGNIAALGIRLTDDEVREIEAAEPFDVGFPLSFLFTPEGHHEAVPANVSLVVANSWVDSVRDVKPIVAGSGEERYNKENAE